MSPMRRWRLALPVALLLAAAAGGQPVRSLTHRIWLLAGVPDDATLGALRAAGVNALVLPVGRVEVSGASSRLTLTPLPDLGPLSGWPVTALVWVQGSGQSSGDAGAFVDQLTPVVREVHGGAGLVLASPRFFPGFVPFAGRVAARLGQRVEVALPAADLAQHVPPGGWPRLGVVAVAFGNPAALGFPPSTLQDDLTALDALDSSRVSYRAAIVVEPRSEPAPGAAGVSLALVAGAETATYTPGERGDDFKLHRPVDWGGVPVAAGQTITVEVVDTARYHRDLGLLLRPVRPRLDGWDTAGLPRPEPALGMSREALLDYLRGGSPYPRPQVEVEWAGPTAVRVALANPTAQTGAIATTGNWVELRFSGTEVRDVQLGDFAGMEFGRIAGDGVWHRTVARDASALRLYLALLPPRARVGGALVTFLTRPREVRSRWRVRLGDGGDATGQLEAASVTTR